MREVVVFGLIGVLATAVHYLSALLSVELLGVTVLLANVLAYCVAVAVSYVGHTRFTFRASASRRNFLRFITVSLSALGLSQLLLFALQSWTRFPYQFNLLLGVGIIPVYSFLCNKFWVYRRPVPAGAATEHLTQG